jgi:hypothetical protein
MLSKLYIKQNVTSTAALQRYINRYSAADIPSTPVTNRHKKRKLSHTDICYIQVLSQGSQKEQIFLKNQPFPTIVSTVKLNHYVLQARCLMPLLHQASHISILTKEAVQSYSKVKPYEYILLSIKINCYWIFGSKIVAICSLTSTSLLCLIACYATKASLQLSLKLRLLWSGSG